ncbi:C-reactive protein-like [Rhinophrynus dorsalis]
MDRSVFLFPKETSTDYVILKPLVTKPLDKLTICLRTYTDLSRLQALFTLDTHNSSNLNMFTIFQIPPQYSSVIVDNELVYFKTDTDVLDWKHTCVGWDSGTGVVHLWIDGKLYPRKLVKKGFSVDLQASIVLGQKRNINPQYDPSQSYVGEITDVHMWDYVLTPQAIKLAKFNNKYFNGNVINWRSLDYDIKGDVLVQPKLHCKKFDAAYNYMLRCYVD